VTSLVRRERSLSLDTFGDHFRHAWHPPFTGQQGGAEAHYLADTLRPSRAPSMIAGTDVGHLLRVIEDKPARQPFGYQCRGKSKRLSFSRRVSSMNSLLSGSPYAWHGRSPGH